MQHARASMGPRGDYDPSARPGDLTGRRYLAQSGAMEDRDRAIKNTRDALAGNEDLTQVSVPGGRAFMIPTEVFRHIREEAIHSD